MGKEVIKMQSEMASQSRAEKHDRLEQEFDDDDWEELSDEETEQYEL